MLIELSGPGKTSLWYADNAGRQHITVSARGLLTNREWRNGFQLRKMEAVFSRLFNSANAVSGSAGLVPYRLAALLRKETPLTALPNTCNASLATAKVKPSPLAVYGDFVMYDK